MGSDQKRAGDTVKSDQGDTSPEGGAGGAPPDDVQGEVAAAPSDDTDTTKEPAQEEAAADATKKKKGKKKDLGIGTSRGIETMFRTSYRVQQDLVAIADAKANIMISVNGLIISIILAAVSPRIGGLPLLVLPTSILLIGCCYCPRICRLGREAAREQRSDNPRGHRPETTRISCSSAIS